MKEAVWQKSSDIHIEPQRDRLRIRFRLDGELQEVSSMPLELYQPIVSRIKVLANLKIDETRVPQDGRFRTVLLGRDIDFRVATFPTPTGEKVAMRVLDPQVGLRGLEELGLLGKNLRTLQEGISKPYGMVLITGPTGSGKTTTLYAIMQILNKEEVNVVSLEDPVEYYIDGLNQSQVHPEIGYDFASGLRQTGHIVLSTLHTNNAAGVIPRLVDMKVEPFLLPAAVNLMVGQRLVSRLCQECISKKEPSGEVKTIIENTLASMDPAVVKESGVSAPYQVFGSKGCPVCKGKGVSGRVALFEILQMTKELEEIVVSRKSEGEIIKEAKRQKMTTLRQDGIIKALKGQVSIEMVLRETEEF